MHTRQFTRLTNAFEVFLTDITDRSPNSRFALLDTAFGIESAVETSEDAFASAVIKGAASRMRRAFITLRKPDEGIKHDSKDQEPKLYERGKEIVHRRVLRRCDIKQPRSEERRVGK